MNVSLNTHIYRQSEQASHEDACSLLFFLDLFQKSFCNDKMHNDYDNHNKD